MPRSEIFNAFRLILARTRNGKIEVYQGSMQIMNKHEKIKGNEREREPSGELRSETRGEQTRCKGKVSEWMRSGVVQVSKQ